MPRVYSYVVRYDVGFAPNPFHGWCTLATCKPDIRRVAVPGDWVVGTGSGDRTVQRAGFLVYAMKVEEILTFAKYWEDPRFERKRPSMRGSLKRAYGDNIYHLDNDGRWLQEDSRHTFPDGSPNPGHIQKDTSADAVLVSSNFSYFGGAGPVVPDPLRSGPDMDLVQVYAGMRCRFTEERVAATIAWLEQLPRGYQSDPTDWPRS
jgi:hypothetical protein